MFQAVVRAGCWFASHVADWKSWALVGCTVAPGFEFEDFEMARREELVKEVPATSGTHREVDAGVARFQIGCFLCYWGRGFRVAGGPSG